VLGHFHPLESRIWLARHNNRPDLCKPIQASKCVEQCVLGKLASSQRPFYVLLYSDCQRWSKQVLKGCAEECKGK
jgi:hypothetical protein